VQSTPQFARGIVFQGGDQLSLAGKPPVAPKDNGRQKDGFGRAYSP
jgi:hypothetical protein